MWSIIAGQCGFGRRFGSGAPEAQRRQVLVAMVRMSVQLQPTTWRMTPAQRKQMQQWQPQAQLQMMPDLTSAQPIEQKLLHT